MTAVQTMRDIAFEKVNDDYAWGNYGDFKVLIMLKNGYINVSKLAKDGGKGFKQWKRLAQAEELQNEISLGVGIPTSNLLMIINGGVQEIDLIIRGTYAHPDLVPHIASWVSAKFAVKVSRIVNEYFAQEARDKIRDITKERDDLLAMMRKLCIDTEEIKANSDKLIEKLDDMSVKNEELNEKLDDLTVTNEILDEKINVISERLAVGPSTADKEMVFMLLSKKLADKSRVYYIIRGQNKAAKAKRNKFRADGYKTKMYFLDPNPIDLTDRVRSKLNNTMIIMRYNEFTLMERVKEKDLLDEIGKIRDQKYRECNLAAE